MAQPSPDHKAKTENSKQAWQPEFKTWKPSKGRRREPTSKLSSELHTRVMTHTYTHTSHTYTVIINKNSFFKKEAITQQDMSDRYSKIQKEIQRPKTDSRRHRIKDSKRKGTNFPLSTGDQE